MNFTFLISLILMGYACFSQTGIKETAFDLMLKGIYQNTVPTVNSETLHQMEPYVLLDTREREEFEVSHIANAKWVGYENFNAEAVQDLSKDTTVVVYCSVGYRSEKIGERLFDLGFKNVHNLYGGIFNWINQENSVVNSQGNSTDSIHAYSKAWGIWLERGIKVY